MDRPSTSPPSKLFALPTPTLSIPTPTHSSSKRQKVSENGSGSINDGAALSGREVEVDSLVDYGKVAAAANACKLRELISGFGPSSGEGGDLHAGTKRPRAAEASTRVNWDAVVARAFSHPHEAGERYFAPPGGDEADDVDETDDGDEFASYKSLHAMMKYDPPLHAVEAVLRAHPGAVLASTFEGSALQIAAESGVSSSRVLKLLVVAELAMRKKISRAAGVTAGKHGVDDVGGGVGINDNKHRGGADAGYNIGDGSDNALGDGNDNALGDGGGNALGDGGGNALDDGSDNTLGDIFVGHNPIRWICEPRISVRTAASLLKWYPPGAFQRPLSGGDDEEGEESPLIEIIDDFARDQDDEEIEDNDEDEDGGGGASYYDSEIEADIQHRSSPEMDGDAGDRDEDTTSGGLPPPPAGTGRRQSFTSLEEGRKERRWEKFLNILYSTDRALLSLRVSPTALPNGDERRSDDGGAAKRPAAPVPFRPVHAWIRCLVDPRLGLEQCRPYGAWSVLHEMGRRFPAEFSARDAIDSNRSAFQTLAESPARDCKLQFGEIREIVECLIYADHPSAFLPRRSDGRLLGHVAMENGWPCQDVMKRKASASCA